AAHLGRERAARHDHRCPGHADRLRFDGELRQQPARKQRERAPANPVERLRDPRRPADDGIATSGEPMPSRSKKRAAPVSSMRDVKIDIYNHVMPQAYLDMMKQHLKDQGILKRMSNLRMLWDIEARVKMLDDKFPDVQQVLTLSLP